MKVSEINVPKRNLSDPRYRPQVVKNTKGKGTYDRRKDKTALRRAMAPDRKWPSDFHSYRRGRDRHLKTTEMGLLKCLRNAFNCSSLA